MPPRRLHMTLQPAAKRRFLRESSALQPAFGVETSLSRKRVNVEVNIHCVATCMLRASIPDNAKAKRARHRTSGTFSRSLA